ncbi:hypothetical protein D3C87_1426520 [compost metagenome]
MEFKRHTVVSEISNTEVRHCHCGSSVRVDPESLTEKTVECAWIIWINTLKNLQSLLINRVRTNTDTRQQDIQSFQAIQGCWIIKQRICILDDGDIHPTHSQRANGSSGLMHLLRFRSQSRC